MWFLATIAVAVGSGCADAVPTSSDGGRIPVDAETIEVRLPFSSFARDYQILSGFQSPAEVPTLTIAHEWAGELESRPVIRFGSLPDVVNVIPPGSTTGAQPDSMFQPVSGKVILRLDTLGLGEQRFELEADAILTPWHSETVSWELAADTLGGRLPWPEPGGGPVRPVDSATWFPIVADSVVFDIDSLTVTEWADADLPDRGLRVRTTTPGSRLSVRRLDLRVMVRSEINPDTLIQISANPGRATFIYTPTPLVSDTVLMVGGAPAARALFRIELPETVDPGPEACARVSCPVSLSADRLLFASLALRTFPTLSPGFAPVDSVAVQVRPVLAPPRLPRSPLSAPIQVAGPPLPPEWFSTEPQTPYEIGMTNYFRSLIQPDTTRGPGPSSTLAILADPEPSGLDVISFFGPGSEAAPELRLILTVTDGVSIP